MKKLTCPNKNHPEWKELEKELPNMAYVIWDANNGYGIDKAPNGEPSKLFSDLLSYYGGNRSAAMQAKSKIYTDGFKMWFNQGLSDINGEPKLTEGMFTSASSKTIKIDNGFNTVFRRLAREIEAVSNTAELAKSSTIHADVMGESKYLPRNAGELIDRLLLKGYYQNPELRTLADSLKKIAYTIPIFVNYDGKEGMAYTSNHRIVIDGGSFTESKDWFEKSIIHELIHHVTLEAYNRPQTQLEHEFKRALDDMYNYYKSKVGLNTKAKNDVYGLLNPEEFIAELMSNNNFLPMARVHYTAKEKLKYFWNRVLKSLTKLLTGEVGAKPSDTVKTMVKQLIEEGNRGNLRLWIGSDDMAKVRKELTSPLVKEYEKSSKIIAAKIEQGIKTRIKSLNQYGKIMDARVRKLEADLAILQDMFEKNEDKQALMEFIKHVSRETRNPIKIINQAFLEFAETGKFSLRNNQLVQLQKDLIGFYDPIIDDINEKLVIPGYFKDMSETEQAFIEQQISLITRSFDILNSKYKQLLAHRFGEILIKYGDEAGSKTIRQYIEDNTNTTAIDLGFYHTFIGSMKFVGDEGLRLIHRRIVDVENEIQRKTTEKASSFLPIVKNVKDWQVFYETDKDGNKTGYLVRDINYGVFKRDYEAFLEELGEAPINDQDKLKEYNTLKNEWLDKHAERRYTKEYYSLFNGLSQAAKVARDNIQVEISSLLLLHTDANGITNLETMSDKDWKILEGLYQKKRMLANLYHHDGTPKTGTHKDIAEELRHINEVLNENIQYTTNSVKFNQALMKKIEQLAPQLYERVKDKNIVNMLEYGRGLKFLKDYTDLAVYVTPELKKWHERNTKIAYTKEFYDELASIEKNEYGDEYLELSEKRSELRKLYRRSYDMQVDVDQMPDTVKDIIKDIDQRMAIIASENKTRKKGEKNEISKLISMEQSVFYKKQKESALSRDKVEPGFYKKWQDENHFIDRNGTLRPYSYMTYMVPLEKRHIEIVPSQMYSEIDTSSTYYNPNFDPSNPESYQPKRSLYDNSVAYKKAMADENTKAMYDAIVSTMEESNRKITFMKRPDAYKLPQISGSMWAHVSSSDNILKGFNNYVKDSVTVKNDDADYNYDNNNTRPDGSRLSTIPTHYIKMLDNPAAITNNLAGAVMAYFKMGENFKQKQEMIPELELLQQQIDKREYQPNITSESDVIRGIKEGIDALRRNRILPKQKQATNTSNRLETFYKMNIFGEKHTPITLGKWNVTKTLNNFKTFSTAVNLGLNAGVAAAGLTTSFHQHLTEAITGVYYTPKTAALAFFECVANYAQIISGWGNYTSSNKLLGLMNFNQVSRSNEEMFKRLNYNRLARFIINHLWYGGMSIGDFFTKSQILTSVYMNIKYVDGEGFISRDEYITKSEDKAKAKREFDNLGSPTLYDIYEKDGSSVKVKDKYSQYNKYLTDEFLNRTRNVVNYLCQRADGMIDETDKNRMHANVLTGFMVMHKSFILSALEDRVLKPKQWNYLLERYDEGSYKTTVRVAFQSLKYLYNLSRYGMGNISEKPIMNKLEDFEKYNVKRVGTELGLLIAYSVLSMMIGNWREEDKDSWIRTFTYYISERTVYEVGNLYNPWDVIDSFKTITPAMSTLENVKTLGSILAFWNWNDNFDKTTKYGPYEGMNKFQKAAFKVTPFKNVIEATDPNQKLKYLHGQLQ